MITRSVSACKYVPAVIRYTAKEVNDMPISRLFRLLYILLERERVPAPELAQTLEVSVRTIYRDVQTLGEAGIPVYAERGRDGGVAILPTFRLNK